MQPSTLPPKLSMAGPAAASGKATASLVLGLVSLLCGCITGLPAMLFGFISMREISRSQGALSGKGLAITGIVLGILTTLVHTALFGFVIFAVVGGGIAGARFAAQRAASKNDLKQVGIATMNHHDVHGQFPHIGNDGETRAGLSWRVKILPYVEEAPLFSQFDQESGWDSSQNFPLAQQRPSLYDGKLSVFPPDGTPYLSPVSALPSDDAKMGIEEGARFVDITDGTSNTIMSVIADPSTVQGPWTMGYDLPVNTAMPSQGLQESNASYLVIMVDGSVNEIGTQVDSQTLLHLMQRNDGSAVMLY